MKIYIIIIMFVVRYSTQGLVPGPMDFPTMCPVSVISIVSEPLPPLQQEETETCYKRYYAVLNTLEFHHKVCLLFPCFNSAQNISK